MKEIIEVIEQSTGAKMAHTPHGEIMSTTLFKTWTEAREWIALKKLDATHIVIVNGV